MFRYLKMSNRTNSGYGFSSNEERTSRDSEHRHQPEHHYHNAASGPSQHGNRPAESERYTNTAQKTDRLLTWKFFRKKLELYTNALHWKVVIVWLYVDTIRRTFSMLWTSTTIRKYARTAYASRNMGALSRFLFLCPGFASFQ
ncbi:hypothetical protein OSTOST_17916 [Ostertagia ostertagi]